MAVSSEANTKKLVGSNLAAVSSVTPTPWIRPKDWLPLPDVTGQQRLAGLIRIDADSNFLALTCAGAYTVDWGDGTTTNHATGTAAQKQYNYADIPNTGESALGYRQVIVQVYPQSGQNLTSVNITTKHTQTGLQSYSSPWLDIVINAASMTSLTIGSATIAPRFLERCHILSHAVTNFSNLFLNCGSLRSVPLFNTASVTNMTSMFQNCSALQEVPLFNTASVTNMSFMFSSCLSLLTVPLFNTASVTNTGSMFTGCQSLVAIPAFNFSNVTTPSTMFQGCGSIKELPALDFSKGVDCRQMFRSMTALKTIPPMNFAAATNIGAMFEGSTSLQKVELTAGSVIATANNLFNNCSSLTSIGGGFSLGAVTAASNIAGLVGNCASLQSCVIAGINQTVSFANCKLSAAAINTIFTNLSSTGTGKTVTVTGNWGAASCDPTIATAKGWTVTQ